MGMAVDLGMEWAPIKNFRVSVAVIDFGSIKWKKDNIITASSSGTASYSGMSNINPDSIGNVGNQFTTITENLMEVTKFRQQTVAEDFIQKLNPTINAGVELGLVGNRVSIAGLYTTKLLDNGERYTDIMGSFNVKPFSWFNLSASYSVQRGNQEIFGFALGFVPGIVNIFLACDYVPTKFAPPYYVPLSALTTNVQLGVSIPLSRRPAKKVVDEEEEQIEEVPVTDVIPPQY